jgi:SMODS and SLOG-associating 2TM effector domain 1
MGRPGDSNDSAAMNLVSYWVIGFAGARRLSQPDAIRPEIGKALRDVKEIADGELVAISSAAVGADLLFVEEITAMSIPWIAVLPFPEDYFFNERDFPDASERDATREAIARAADCEIIRTPRDSSETKDSAWRRTALADGGFRCVDECDVFIAVLHETNEPGKRGGTAEVVAYARTRKRPILIIDPETLETRQENWRTRLSDELTEELRRLPLVVLSADKRANYPTPSALALAEWRNSFAAPARKRKFQIQWGNTAVVILSALAAFITALVFLLLHEAKAWISFLDWVAFVCVLSGFVFLAWVLWKKPHARGADYRFAAEIGRSFLTVWNIPGTVPRILRSPPKNFAHFVKSLVLQHRLDADRLRDQRRGTLSETQINELARAYLDARVQDQLDRYYSPRFRKSRRLAILLQWTCVILSIVAVVSAGFLVFTPDWHRDLWGVTKLAAAIAIPVAVSMIAIHEARRREARYGEMCKTLSEYAQQIGHARSLTTLQDLVVDVEHLFLSETYEWWILAKENVAA